MNVKKVKSVTWKLFLLIINNWLLISYIWFYGRIWDLTNDINHEIIKQTNCYFRGDSAFILTKNSFNGFYKNHFNQESIYLIFRIKNFKFSQINDLKELKGLENLFYFESDDLLTNYYVEKEFTSERIKELGFVNDHLYKLKIPLSILISSEIVQKIIKQEKLLKDFNIYDFKFGKLKYTRFSDRYMKYEYYDLITFYSSIKNDFNSIENDLLVILKKTSSVKSVNDNIDYLSDSLLSYLINIKVLKVDVDLEEYPDLLSSLTEDIMWIDPSLNKLKPGLIINYGFDLNKIFFNEEILKFFNLKRVNQLIDRDGGVYLVNHVIVN
ncbi:hypothetical protein A0H76_1971 [Hepatospora eriocheir]|uniref:Uncharacterized protein n=1 Tax=Hepatospora eriocheir TaxID=1081669 RepID=A0A1X0QKC8_9MICR|nr:hypothetical protein A0H76_1971 [Hepatospora eriocheir]